MKRETVVGIIFSFSAAIAYGISQVLVRSGMQGLAPPLVGAGLSLLAGTIVLSFFALRNRGEKLKQKKKSVGLMLLAGIFAGSGIIANYFALSKAPVTMVSPLTATNPIFALLWSYLFLGQLEKITPRVVLGTIFVVGGVVLVTIGRTI